VDGAQVGVLKEVDEVALRGLLESHDRVGLEAKVSFEILSNLANKALERRLADEKPSRFLVLADLTERDSSGAVAVRLLDASGLGPGLLRLMGQLKLTRLTRLLRLDNCRPLNGLSLGARHYLCESVVL